MSRPSRPAAAPAKSPPAAPARAVKRAAHEVRIIGGLWKRSRLPVADRPGLRPTPDRVRETLFNWLTHLGGGDLDGWICLDAFAGTGALGLEAASRGASAVVLVERDGSLVASLEAVCRRLQANTVQVQQADGVRALQAQPAGSLDLVLLDPPFDAGLFEPALQAAVHAVRPQGGLIYLEAPQAWETERLLPLGLRLLRHLKAGAVHAHLLERLPSAPAHPAA